MTQEKEKDKGEAKRRAAGDVRVRYGHGSRASPLPPAAPKPSASAKKPVDPPKPSDAKKG